MQGRIWCFSKFSLIFRINKMPKKFKKSKPKNVPIYKNILTIDNKEYADVVKNLHEMFPNIDKKVVQLIVDESENNVEQALETLITLSHTDKEDEDNLTRESPNDENIKFSNISKIFKKSVSIDPDNAVSSYACAAGSTSSFTTECMSNSIENFKSTTPQFIVPSVPMHGSQSPHKPYLDANKAFWNVSDSKYFSTSSSNDGTITDSSIKLAIRKIKQYNRILIILRGLPGSGKSSLALKLKFSGVIFSADDFFMKGETYVYDCTMLSEAHAWNQNRTKKALQEGITPVIIDNTNTEAWEMKPYVLMGKAHNYEIIILEPDTPWKFNIRELAYRNKHGVSKSKIAKMKERYAKNITVEKILTSERLFSSFSQDTLDKGSSSFKQYESMDLNTDKIDNKSTKENCISLEAVIHREDNSFEETCLINNLQLSVQNLSVTENSVHCQPTVLCNLDELRTLTRNDSDESHSSVNGSLQEISGWEAITEPDDSFRWSTSSSELKYNAKRRSMDNLSFRESLEPLSSEGSASSSSTSVENLTSTGDDSSIAQDKFKSPSKSDPTELDLKLSNFENMARNNSVSNLEISLSNKADDIKGGTFQISEIKVDGSDECWSDPKLVNEDAIVHHSLYQTDLINKDNLRATEMQNVSDEIIENISDDSKNLIFDPKPCRTDSIPLQTLSEIYVIDQPVKENIQNTEDCSLEWNISNDKMGDNLSDSYIEKQSIPEINSTPKPQRKIFESKFSKMKNNMKSNCGNKKSLLNISFDSDWKFPEYVQDDTHHTSTSINKNVLSFKMVAYSQTETRDFDLMHQIAVGNSTLDCCNYKILHAKFDNDSYSAYFNSKSYPSNFETISYSEIPSYDKSTCTDDLVDTVEISQKLSYLQECFPDISKEDLLHHLEICHNNERWLSNLLLDWGYKYNVPEKSFKNSSEETLNSDENDNTYKKVSTSVKKKYSQNTFLPSSSDIEDSSSSTSNNVTDEFKEKESNSVKETKTLRLILDPDFAHQLEEHFGPVSNSENRCVDIDIEIAELIYRKWKNATTDPAQNLKTGGKKCKFKKRMKCTAAKPHKEPSSFSEIMDQELAFQLHKEEKLKKDENFETKLKRLELYNMFPGADTVVLDDIFENNNCSLKESLEALGEEEIEARKKEIVEKRKVVDKIEKDISSWKKLQIFHEFETGDWNDWVYKDDSINSGKETVLPMVSPALPTEAAALREEANEHYQLRYEFIKKARRAFDTGMTDVASFYAQQGRDHAEMSKKANQEASVLIAKARNSAMQYDSLDLHSLYTKEAISLLDKFLKEKKVEIKRNNRKIPLVVSVITGKGNHSIQGPKIQPAVENFLRSHGYSYCEIQSGKFDVTILPE